MPKLDLRNAVRIKTAAGEVAALKGAGFSWTKPVTGETIGGSEVGAAGAAGTIYEGYTLSWGDDFNSLDILTPAQPRGKWWTTRTYFPDARGSDTLLGTQYDTDPFHTGYFDSNRGDAIGYDNMRVEDSAVVLQARRATAGEIEGFEGAGRLNVAAMLSGVGTYGFFPGPEGTGDTIIEARIKYTPKAGNPAGWHPTLWTFTAQPTLTFNSDEADFEGNSQGAYAHSSIWTNGVASVQNVGGVMDVFDGTYHLITLRQNKTATYFYIDGVLTRTLVRNANSKNLPISLLLTSHIFNGSFEGENYSAGAWAADADGATMTIDYVRGWRRSANPHIKPIASLNDVNVDYGASTTITLPSKTVLWGDETVTEYLQAVMTEENEPGGSHTTAINQFPAGVSYNAGTRVLTVNITSGLTGRINFLLIGHKADGSTYEPARFAVNVGPRVNMANLVFEPGEVVSFDIYAACDCGVLVSDANGARAKTITVTGLSGSGLSYSDATGLLTGTAAEFSGTITITVTNSLGQAASATRTLTVEGFATPAYESWAGPGWYDASEAGTLTLSGSNVTALANRRAGGGDLTAAGPATGVRSGVRTQNGLNVISVTRDVSTPSSIPRLQAATVSPVSEVFQGDDKPYTVITVYIPKDTNTGYIWASSRTVDATNSQQIALIRRNATASSVRKALTTATPNDVSWGSGQAADVPRIVAVKHSGTAVTVWDNSATTKAVDSVAQNTNPTSTVNTFRLFASETSTGTPPGFATVQSTMDFCEIVIEGTARSDAEIQQAITDLAAKWGVTLS